MEAREVIKPLQMNNNKSSEPSSPLSSEVKFFDPQSPKVSDARSPRSPASDLIKRLPMRPREFTPSFQFEQVFPQMVSYQSLKKIPTKDLKYVQEVVESERQTFVGLITSLEAQCQEIRKQRDSFSDIISIQRQQLQGKEQIFEKFQLKLISTEKQLNEYQMNLEKKEKETSSMARDIVDLRNKLSKEREQSLKLQEQFQQERKEMEAFTSKVLDETSLDKLEETLVTELKNEMSKISKLQNDLIQLRVENKKVIEQLDSEIQMKREAERYLNQTKGLLKQMEQTTKKTVEYLQKNNDQLKIEKRQLEELLDYKDQTIKELNQQKQSLKEELLTFSKRQLSKSAKRYLRVNSTSNIANERIEEKYQIPQLRQIAAVSESTNIYSQGFSDNEILVEDFEKEDSVSTDEEEYVQQIQNELIHEVESHSLTRVALAKVQNELNLRSQELQEIQQTLNQSIENEIKKDTRIKTLEEEMKKQKAEANLSQIQNQLTGLKTQLDEASKKEDEAQFKIEKEKLLNQVKELENSLDMSNAEKKQLSRELEELKVQFKKQDNLQLQIAQFQTEIEAKSEEYKEKELQWNEERKKLKENAVNFSTQIGVSQHQLEKSQAEVGELQKQIDTFKATIRKFTEEKNQTHQLNEKLNLRSKELEQQIESLQQLVNKSKEKEEKLKLLEAQLAQKEEGADLVEMPKQPVVPLTTSTLQPPSETNLAVVNSKIREIENFNLQLQQEIQSFQKRYQTLQEEKNLYQKNFQNEQQISSNLRNDIEKEKKNSSILQGIIANLQNQIQELNQKLDEEWSNRAKLEQAAGLLRKELDSKKKLESKNQQLLQDINSLQEQLKKLELEKAELSKEQKTITQEYKNAEKEDISSLSESETSDDQTQIIQEKLDQETFLRQQAESEMKELKQRIEDLQSQLKLKIEEKSKDNINILSIETQMEELKKQLKMEIELKQTAQELEELQKKNILEKQSLLEEKDRILQEKEAEMKLKLDQLSFHLREEQEKNLKMRIFIEELKQKEEKTEPIQSPQKKEVTTQSSQNQEQTGAFIQSLQTQIEAYRQSTLNLQLGIQEKEQKIKEQEAKLLEYFQHIETLKSTIQTLSSQRSVDKELVEENGNLKQKLQETQQQLAQLLEASIFSNQPQSPTSTFEHSLTSPSPLVFSTPMNEDFPSPHSNNFGVDEVTLLQMQQQLGKLKKAYKLLHLKFAQKTATLKSALDLNQELTKEIEALKDLNRFLTNAKDTFRTKLLHVEDELSALREFHAQTAQQLQTNQLQLSEEENENKRLTARLLEAHQRSLQLFQQLNLAKQTEGNLKSTQHFEKQMEEIQIKVNETHQKLEELNRFNERIDSTGGIPNTSLFSSPLRETKK